MSESTQLLGRRSSTSDRRSSLGRARTSFSLGLNRAANLSRDEVHPESTEPLLPAHAVDPNEATRLHSPRWSAYEGEPNGWAKFRHVWREEFA